MLIDPKIGGLVVEEDGRVVGMGVLREESTLPYDVFVPHRYAKWMEFYVHPAYRGKNIGTKLLNFSKEWTRQRGLEYLELTVLEQNKRAAALYRREGFYDVQRQMRYWIERKESFEKTYLRVYGGNEDGI